MRIVVEVINRAGRIVAHSAVGDDSVLWIMQTSAIVKSGNVLRARLLGEDEHPLDIERATTTEAS